MKPGGVTQGVGDEIPFDVCWVGLTSAPKRTPQLVTGLGGTWPPCVTTGSAKFRTSGTKWGRLFPRLVDGPRLRFSKPSHPQTSTRHPSQIHRGSLKRLLLVYNSSPRIGHVTPGLRAECFSSQPSTCVQPILMNYNVLWLQEQYMGNQRQRPFHHRLTSSRKGQVLEHSSPCTTPRVPDLLVNGSLTPVASGF